MAKKKSKSGEKKGKTEGKGFAGSPSWEQIGRMAGQKIGEEMRTGPCAPWRSPWLLYRREEGGGFGRLIFIISLLIALNYMGMLDGVPGWNLVLLAIGFALMRF